MEVLSTSILTLLPRMVTISPQELSSRLNSIQAVPISHSSALAPVLLKLVPPVPPHAQTSLPLLILPVPLMQPPLLTESPQAPTFFSNIDPCSLITNNSESKLRSKILLISENHAVLSSTSIPETPSWCTKPKPLLHNSPLPRLPFLTLLPYSIGVLPKPLPKLTVLPPLWLVVNVVFISQQPPVLSITLSSSPSL